MNVRNGSIDAVDNSRRIRSFFYSYLFTSLNSIIDLNAKNPPKRVLRVYFDFRQSC
jgi:hypothetical protein